MRNRALTAALAVALAASPAVVGVVASAEAPAPAAVSPPEVPAGFQDLEVIPGLSESTTVAFAPDGTAFLGLKPGVVKAFDYNAATGQYEGWASHTDVISLVNVVHNYHDRGLTGLAVDPQFGTAGHNFIYLNYAYDRDPRDEPRIVPKWGSGGPGYDDCAAPAAMGPPVVTGCVGMTRVSRVPVTKGANGYVASGAEQPLVDLPAGQAACQQFGSHASGDVVFGPDGMLYASAGDGASFDSLDYGQAGNPCADPTNEGGALRAQDIRTSGDPLGIGGTIFRINPDGGQVATGAQANASRIVTYGQRNPWRLTFRPGTNELWSGDVGASGFEEVNRTDMTAFTGPVNLGWPCYEGAYTGLQKNVGWDQLDKPICENLYAAETASPGTVRPPYFSYQTRGSTGPLTPGEHCEQGTSSISGVAFIPTTSTYPAQYRGAMFFNDFARACVWYLAKKANGDPDPASIQPFVQRAESPVQVKVGPGGDLFYVDYGIVDGNVVAGAGGLHRIVYTTGNRQPVAAVTANPSAGPAPLNVSFSAAGSTDPDGDPLTYAWDLDGDGQFDDGTGVTQSRTYSSPGNVTVTVQVGDGRGGSDTESVVVSPGNSPPQITSMSPNASFTWTAGQNVTLSATATDAQETLPDSAFSWSVIIEHCPSVCHTHPLTGGTGKSVSFTTVGHEYPAHLLVTLTVTDSQGLTDIETVQLDPKTVDLTFATNPAGGAMTIAGAGVFSGHTQRFIVNSTVDVSVPDTRTYNGANYSFTSWSDGGARSHSFNAPASGATYTATYARQNRLPSVTVGANPTSGPAPLAVSLTANATDPDGDNAGFTYEWALDGDGVFDDGGGATKSKTYSTAGTRTVQVRVTDTHGGQATGQVAVTVGAAAPNQPPQGIVYASPGDPGPAPLATTFYAQFTDPEGTPLSYKWDLDEDGQFDDGGTAATQPVTFTKVGVNRVYVQVTDADGGQWVAFATLQVLNRNPTVSVSAAPASGNAPLTSTFTATASDPDATALTYAWDLDGNGSYETPTAGTPTASRTFTAAGSYPVGVQVTDADGGKATATTAVSVTVPSGNTPPVLGTVTPASTVRWTAGGRIDYSATATDTQDGTLPSSAFTWTLQKSECATGCSPVQVGSPVTGATGFFTAPALRYPAYLLVTVTAKDSGGLTATRTTRLDPSTVTLRFTSSPSGFDVGATRTAIVGETVTLSAPDTVKQGQKVYRFSSWSDGGARVHTVTAPGSDRTYTATYVRVRQRVTFVTKPGALELRVAGRTRRSGYDGTFDVGDVVRVTAPRRQRLHGVVYEFIRWSDGGARVHGVVVTETATELRAVYKRTRSRQT